MLDEARPTPSPGTRRRLLAFTSLGHFINDGSTFLVPLLAAILAARSGVSAIAIAAVLALFYASAALGSPLVGAMADRFGPPARWIGPGLVLVGGGLALFFLAVAVATGPALLLVAGGAAVLSGFGSAFYHPLGAAVLQAGFPPEQRGTALGINGSFGSIGRAAYPALLFLLAAGLTEDGALGLYSGLAVAAGAVVAIGFARGIFPRPGGGAGGRPRIPARAAVTRGIVLLTAVGFVRSIATQALVAWVPTEIALARGTGISPSLGFALTGMFAAAIVGQPVFGLLADRVPRRALLAASTAGSGLSFLGYLAVSGPIAYLLLAGFGFCTFSAFPLLMSLAGDYVPGGPSSLANALVFGLGASGGGVVGPLLVGVALGSSYAGLDGVLAAMALLGLASAVLPLLLPKPPVRRAGRLPLFG